MTQAELDFLQSVPRTLREIAKELKEIKSATGRIPSDGTVSLTLTGDDLSILSRLCRTYKDYHRNSRDDVKEVMELEAKLSKQSGGTYEADTTYDIR